MVSVGVAKAGLGVAKEGIGALSKQIAELSAKIMPAAKGASDRVIVVGREAFDAAPSLIKRYPKASVAGAGLLGAGGITGLYMGLEAASPYIPGDFNFAFGSDSPGGNVWKPFDPETGKFKEEKKDYGYLKYVAIAGVGVAGLFGLGYLIRQANTTVELVQPVAKRVLPDSEHRST